MSGPVRVLANKDTLAGLMFALAALVAAVKAPDYGIGTARQMGSGYFPLGLGIFLALLSLALLWKGIAGRDPVVPLEGEFRSLVCTAGSVLLFALLLRPAGLILTVIAVTLLSSLGSPRFRFWPSLAMGAALAGFCYAVFIAGIGLLIPIWPAYLRGW